MPQLTLRSRAIASVVTLASFASAAALGLALAGCLPGDTRPVPERVYVTVEPSPGLTEGIDTADGWRISFDRFLIAMGHVDFENDDATCNSYAEARYDRLFDFAFAGREKLGTAYGLGTCRVEFRVRSPSFDVVLGPGAVASDAELMRLRGSDPHAKDERASVLVIGKASRGGGESKRFEWAFRESFELTNCEAEGGGFGTTLELTEAGSSELRLEVRAEELFRAIPDDSADFRFQLMANADADADGLITFEELANIPVTGVGSGSFGGEGGAGGTSGAGGSGGEGVTAALVEMLYKDHLRRVVRVLGGGPCVEEDDRRF